MNESRHEFVVVMGVSGCGKSTVGIGLAEKLNAVFYDGDDLHPASNIRKMSSGIPLTDEDRWPWLDIICDLAVKESSSRSIVVACSALKKSYRERLARGPVIVRFLFLSGSQALITRRQSDREGHFMPSALIESQFATLEDPTAEANVAVIDIDQPIAQIVESSFNEIKRSGST